MDDKYEATRYEVKAVVEVGSEVEARYLEQVVGAYLNVLESVNSVLEVDVNAIDENFS